MKASILVVQLHFGCSKGRLFIPTLRNFIDAVRFVHHNKIRKRVMPMVKSVKKAIDILFYLSNDPENAIQLNQICKALDLNKSTCSHLLDTLCDSLMVEHVSRKEGYRLGPNAYLLTRYGRYQESLIEICSPIIRWLREKVSATVFLTVVCDGIKYIIFHEDGGETLDLRNGEIIKGNIETTASGQLMMAYMDQESLDRVCRRSEDAGRFAKEMASREGYFRKIRERGYAHLYDEVNNRHSFAFRIWDGRKTVASIGLTYPDAVDSPQTRSHVTKMGRAAAEEINRRLRFAPNTRRNKEESV